MSSNELVSTTLLRETGSQRYSLVVFSPVVSKVSYRVHCVKNGEPSDAAFQSGVLESKLSGQRHAFVIPVAKGVGYFIEACLDYADQPSSSLTWVLEPFKRRKVSREDLAPASE